MHWNNGKQPDTYDNHLLPCSLSESLGPSHFAWVSLHPNAGIRERDPAGQWMIILLKILMASVVNMAVNQTYWDLGQQDLL